MNYLPVLVITVLVPIILKGFSSIAKKEIASYHLVAMPKVFAWVAAVSTACSFACMIYILSAAEDGIAPVLLCAFAALSLLFWIAYFSVRIEYDATGFRVKKLFRRKRQYGYEDILAQAPLMGNGCVFVMRSGRIRVDDFMVGGVDFIDYAEYQYRTLGLGFGIPDDAHGPFRGNVKDPWPMMIIACIVGAILLLFAVGCTVSVIVENEPLNEVADVLLFVWGMTVLYWICCFVGNHILCNAQKYPRLAKLLVKKEYRNF